METVAFEIIELNTDKVIHRVDVSPEHRSERQLERIESGLLRKVDPERFYVREVKIAS